MIKILEGDPSVDSKTAMAFFAEWLEKYASHDTYKRLMDEAKKNDAYIKQNIYENSVNKKKPNYSFLDRDPLFDESFTFTPGKNPVHDISDRCAAWFPGSDDPTVKNMELTFKKLPNNFKSPFRIL